MDTKAFAIERRKRLVAGILNAIESSPGRKKMTNDEWQQIRQVVQEQIGVYHDVMLDMIKVCGADTTVNAHALELIESLHQGQQRLERALSRG